MNEFKSGMNYPSRKKEQDELLLTEIVDVLANIGTRCFNAGQDWRSNPINYQEKAQEILAKVKQHYPIMYQEEAELWGWFLENGWLPPLEVERLKQHYEQKGLPLFQLGDFKLHSGQGSRWKIECDALTDADWDTLASLVAERLDFAVVHGIPRGGLRFASALQRYVNPFSAFTLIVDDVLTTGRSMEEARLKCGVERSKGVVVFARNKCPSWIQPLFSMEQKRLDRPELREIATKIAVKTYDMAMNSTVRPAYEESVVRKATLEWAISEIEALIPDIQELKNEWTFELGKVAREATNKVVEEAKKQERERVFALGDKLINQLVCSRFVPKEHREYVEERWQALKETGGEKE